MLQMHLTNLYEIIFDCAGLLFIHLAWTELQFIHWTWAVLCYLEDVCCLLSFVHEPCNNSARIIIGVQ